MTELLDRLRPFPEGFLWGVATSAYQIEGAAREAGRGESIWDRFSHTPGTIADGSTGDVAADHYHRWPEDLAIMAELGVPAYRFSIAWPRVMPTGRPPLNRPGLDFYDRLVDALLERGIAPLPTLFHWDLPQDLQDRGGWLDRDTVARFGEYAASCFERFGDRVGTWFTINEPAVAAFDGHLRGVHAPGLRDLRSALAAAHHLLLAHGTAVRQLRAGGHPGRISIPLNLWPLEPASGAAADHEAARAADGHANRWFLDPVLRGRYPDDLMELYLRRLGELEFIQAGDGAAIGEPIDVLGVNYYSRSLVRARPSAARDDLPWEMLRPAPGAPVTEMGWEVVPEGLTELLRRLHREYAVPLLISENGAAFADTVSAAGTVEDPARTRYLVDHLIAIQAAIEAGVPVQGYLWWSFLDNFEWAQGYTKRFGVVHVDYATQRRTVKASGRYYSRIIAGNGLRPTT
jgi:beta-glucosidase